MGVQEEAQTQEHKIDPAISVDAMNAYGYTDENMQPLSKEQALELYERDVPVYMLYTDNTESMACFSSYSCTKLYCQVKM